MELLNMLEQIDEEEVVRFGDFLPLHPTDEADRDPRHQQKNPRVKEDLVEQFRGEDATPGPAHLIYGISAQNPLEIPLVPRGSQPLPLDAPPR